MNLRRAVFPAAAALALSICLLLCAKVLAQQGISGGLPTAPAADRANQGGLSQAPASLPGGPNGASPLEPYLVTWLLPVSGIIAVAFGVYVDRRLRVAYGRTSSMHARRAN